MSTARKTMHISDAIEAGIAKRNVHESHDTYISKQSGKELYDACALGCALIGLMPSTPKADSFLWSNKPPETKGHHFIASSIGLPYEIAKLINSDHCDGHSARKIAETLRAQPELIVHTPEGLR